MDENNKIEEGVDLSDAFNKKEKASENEKTFSYLSSFNKNRNKKFVIFLEFIIFVIAVAVTLILIFGGGHTQQKPPAVMLKPVNAMPGK